MPSALSIARRLLGRCRCSRLRIDELETGDHLPLLPDNSQPTALVGLLQEPLGGIRGLRESPHLELDCGDVAGGIVLGPPNIAFFVDVQSPGRALSDQPQAVDAGIAGRKIPCLYKRTVAAARSKYFLRWPGPNSAIR